MYVCVHVCVCVCAQGALTRHTQQLDVQTAALAQQVASARVETQVRNMHQQVQHVTYTCDASPVAAQRAPR